jgi:hypothetical protein
MGTLGCASNLEVMSSTLGRHMWGLFVDFTPDPRISLSTRPHLDRGARHKRRTLQRDDPICAYDGPLVPEDLLDLPEYATSQYLWRMQERKDVVIDARDPLSCMGRFANDGFHRCNAYLDYHDDTASPQLIADEELVDLQEILATADPTGVTVLTLFFVNKPSTGTAHWTQTRRTPTPPLRTPQSVSALTPLQCAASLADLSSSARGPLPQLSASRCLRSCASDR